MIDFCVGKRFRGEEYARFWLLILECFVVLGGLVVQCVFVYDIGGSVEFVSDVN